MTTRSSGSVLGPLIRAVASTGADPADGDLLGQFLDRRDEGAFAALVRRHGPMVMGVCRRVLPNEPDAEDAFQATFLILALKASSVRPMEGVGNWLYGVARTTALKARRTSRRRAQRERPVSGLPEPESVPRDDHWGDLLPILDRELSRLADRYRAVIVLCDLEGATRQEAARQLGLPEGTVNSRLSRARALLAKRLTRHDVPLSVSSLVAALSRNATASVPASVASSTAKVSLLTATGGVAATGVISAHVAALTHGMGRAMLATKFKLVTPVVLMLGALGLTYSLATGQPEGNGPDSKLGRVVGDDEKVTVPPVPDAGGEGTKTSAPRDGDWHPLTKNTFVAVHVERCLYEVKGEKRFLMAVRITNLTDAEIGIDLRGKQPGFYPNQWGVRDTKQRTIIDEQRAILTAPGQDKLRADFKAGRLTAILAGKSVTTYTEFNNSGRADVDRCKGKYLVVTLVGQVVATDGKAVETASYVGAERDIVLPFPVTWKATGGAVGVPDHPVQVSGNDETRTIKGVVKEVDDDSILLVGGERVMLTEKTKYLRETGDDPTPVELFDVTKGSLVFIGTKKQEGKLVATVVVIELIQPKPKGVEGNKNKIADEPHSAVDPDSVMKAMDGFRKKLPEPQGLNEQNGTGVRDIDGVAHPDSHLNGIATRLGVKTRAECFVLLTYLKDPDPKIRRIAAFAIEGMVKAYPSGMSSDDMQKVDSEGHRKMVKAFITGIEKLTK